MSAVISKIDQAGRISISAQHRRALELDGGSPVVISLVGKELRVRSMDSAMGELQAEAGRFLHNEAASVDSFIAQRRSEVENEEELTSPDEPHHQVEPESEP